MRPDFYTLKANFPHASKELLRLAMNDRPFISHLREGNWTQAGERLQNLEYGIPPVKEFY